MRNRRWRFRRDRLRAMLWLAVVGVACGSPDPGQEQATARGPTVITSSQQESPRSEIPSTPPLITPEQLGAEVLSEQRRFVVVARDVRSGAAQTYVPVWDSPFLYNVREHLALGTEVLVTARYRRAWSDYYLVRAPEVAPSGWVSAQSLEPRLE